MARGGRPDDELEVLVRRGRASVRRSSTLALGLVVAVLAAAAPGGRPPVDEAHLEVGGGPRPPVPAGVVVDRVVTGTSLVEEAGATSSTSSSLSSSTSASGSSSGWGTAPEGSDASPMTLAMMTAEVLAPVQALSAIGDGVPVGTSGPSSSSSTSSKSSTSSTAGVSTVPPPTFAPTTTTPSSTGTTKAPTTTKPPTSTTTTTTQPPTTTTTRPTTTTTRPTTTTQPPPCTWSGRVQVARSGFVFDGQSNAVSPEWRLSFPIKLMEARFDGRPFKITAKGATNYATRTGWAAEKTDPHAGLAPCMVLMSHGGESDLLEGMSARGLAEAIQAYVAGRRAAGFDVIVVPTIPPALNYDAQEDATRRAFNDGMRKGYRSIGIDVLVDVAALPELQDPNDQRYFSDGLHLTAAGAVVVAEAYSRALP